METLKDQVDRFLFGSGYGSGSGDGSGYGFGDGSGYGFGDGDGFGDGYGSGSGDGSGDGYGSGSGDGSGYGYGFGDGYGIKSLNRLPCGIVDGVLTAFSQIRGNIAKGFIVSSDLTMTPCWIVKSGHLFAHGKSLREAMSDLWEKMFDDMPEEDRIKAFVDKHYPKTPYPNRELFDWHHRLTGSCLAGREEFVRRMGIDLDGETTPEEFIRLTEHDYGSDVIKKLKEFYVGN